MKYEEMAEKYAEDFVKDKYGGNRHCAEVQEEKLFLKIGFQDGLKAGRPQWHKVADGDNLLTVGRRYLVSNRYCTMIGYWNGKTFVSADEDVTEIASPIAWCEIPKFEVEK